MSLLDSAVIGLYFLISLTIGLLMTKRAGRSREEFFLSGRKLPWWIAGTAMVATTFAADTPLAVTELVASGGIAGNWLWWNMLAGNILTVFFFAALWRRADILTDVEFIEIRYSGKPAAFLRGFKAVYLGVFMNCLIMGWVNVALAEILKVIFGVEGTLLFFIIIGAMLFVGLYSALAGQWGIVLTDAFQFIIAMGGCIALAVIVLGLPEVGGVSGLKAALPPETFSFFPDLSGGSAAAGLLSLSFSAFIAHIAVQWWASYYPGAEPGGGGYVAQKMMSAKDEKHARLSVLWFSIAHYALRPWPWILVALAALVLYPGLEGADRKAGFVMAMRDHLPSGLLGLLVAAFLAAYMSTISTHLNWGSSYIVNDLYRRFMKPDADERHYVRVSRLVTMLLVALSSMLIFVIESISGAWSFLIECGAGMGLVLILRWYWWRINAWAEIVSMIAPAAGFAAATFLFGMEFPERFFFVVAFTTICWISAMLVTKPVSDNTLASFYLRVRPEGPGWSRIRRRLCISEGKSTIPYLLVCWISGIALVYAALFGTGSLILGDYLGAAIMGGGCVIMSFLIAIMMKKTS